MIRKIEEKRVLIVTNGLSDEEVLAAKKALENEHSNSNFSIRLSLVHVIPHLPTCYFNIPSIGMLIEKYYEEAKKTLEKVGSLLTVSQRDRWLISGKLRTEVLRLAGQLGIHKTGSSFILASSEELRELQRSLFFKHVHQYAMIRNVNHLAK